MRSVRRPPTWHWLVIALLSLFVAFSLTALVAAQEAQAKGKSDGGGGGDRSGGGGGDRSGGGDSGGGDPVGDAVGGVTKQLDGGGGGDRSGGENLLNDGGTGGGKKEGPLLSDSPLAANEPKAALADTKPVVEKASGGLLGGANGETTDRVLSNDPILKATSPTTDPVPALAPAVEGTTDALQGATKPTGAPLVETADDLTSPITDQLGEATQQPLRIVAGSVTPVREALGPVLGNTAGPLLTTAEPLLEPGIGPVVGKVAPTVPLEGTPAAPTLREQIPAAELYAPVGGGMPALSPTSGSELGTATAFEPAEASVSAPLFEPSVAVGEGASLPVLQATEAPATTLLPTVSSSVLGATEKPAIATSSAPNHAAGSATAASEKIPASGVSPTIDAREEASTVPGKSSHQWVAPFGITVFGNTGLWATPTGWAGGFLVDDHSPFSTSTLPVASSAFGGSAGSASGFGLGLLGALALILALVRVDTLTRSVHDTFGTSSYLQLAIERPG